MGEAALQGFLTGLSLILAIGAQNAFVLRQGLKRQHVGLVVAICAASDAALIAAGVGGMGRLVDSLPWLLMLLRWFGVGFLFLYGLRRFAEVWRGGARMEVAGAAESSARAAALMCLMFTWANPHVYLDTVVLVGGLAAQAAPYEAWFGMGAAGASVFFFTSLGYGARFLTPVFQRPRAWVVLDLVIGATMWALALKLALGG